MVKNKYIGIMKKAAAIILAGVLLTGCSGSKSGANAAADNSTVTAEPAEQIAEDTGKTEETATADQLTEIEPLEKTDENSGEDSSIEAAIAKDGAYYLKDDVALYLYTYHELPLNFITKKEAGKLGWEGGKLEPYAPGKAIGGDYFGNYEGILPEDEKYHECDIDTEGKSRGAKRIVYSDNWNIYYTEDHYEHFELLYTVDGEAEQ